MKNRKVINILIALFSCITLISVGFASWTIVNGGSSVSGNITAEDIIYSNDYIKVVNTKKLTFCQTGFVTDNKKTNSSILKLQVTLFNLNDFKKKYASNNNLNVELKFTSNVIDNNLVVTNNINTTNTIKPSNIINSKLSNGINSSFILNDILVNDSYVFDVDYTFNYKGSELDFKNIYFNKLIDVNLFNILVLIYNK